MNEIGERIRYLRTTRQWSLQKLGDEMGGTSKGYIYNIENGEVNPSIGTLEKVAAAFGMPVSELLGEKGRELTSDECALLDAYRSGDKLAAIRIIMDRGD